MNAVQTFEPPLRLESAASMLTVSVKTVRRLIKRGQLPSFFIGGRRHVLASEIQAYIQRQIARGGGHA